MAAPPLPNLGELLQQKFRLSKNYSREMEIRDLQEMVRQQAEINNILDARLRALEPP